MSLGPACLQVSTGNMYVSLDHGLSVGFQELNLPYYDNSIPNLLHWEKVECLSTWNKIWTEKHTVAHETFGDG